MTKNNPGEVPPSEVPPSEAPIEIRQIRKILPHGYPFLLVDKVVHLDLEANEIIAQKNVTINEEFFQGHFPGTPIMPGVLLIEAMAQAGGILIHKKGNTERIALLMNVANAKFRKPVIPGDILKLHAKAVHVTQKAGKIKAMATVDNNIVVEAELSYALIEKSKI